MARYSREDILKLVKELDVKFIRLQFTDILGTLKNVAITTEQLEKALDNKCMFDGSSIEGFVRIEESDMYLAPDPSTFAIFPWRPQTGKVARLICDVINPDGTPFIGDPRYVLKKALKKAADMGYDRFNVGPECEFSYSLPTVKANPQQGRRIMPDTSTSARWIWARMQGEAYALPLRIWVLKSRLLTMRWHQGSMRLTLDIRMPLPLQITS